MIELSIINRTAKIVVITFLRDDIGIGSMNLYGEEDMELIPILREAIDKYNGRIAERLNPRAQTITGGDDSRSRSHVENK